MPKIILKIIPVLICWGIVIFIILKVPYPESLAQANVTYLALFFAVLYFALAFAFNIVLRNIFLSSSIALGVILLLLLKALDSLNIITGALILISVGLLISYFKKTQRRDVTKLPKIPKLISLHRKAK